VSAQRFTATTVLKAILIAAAGVVIILPAGAQTPPREVLLGISRVGSAGVTADAPTQLYDSASALVRGGNVTAGQRQLEQLVARFPDSESAARARRDLAVFYAAVKPVAAVPAADQMSHLGVPPSAIAASPANAWRTTVRPAIGSGKAAQEGLRDAAGDLVFFSEGSAELGARARKVLAAQAQWLVRNGGHPVVVEGHADEIGSAAELAALASARAAAVRDRLVEEGVAADRIRVVAFGNTRPVAMCADQSCSSQNRRAATIVGGNVAAQLR